MRDLSILPALEGDVGGRTFVLKTTFGASNSRLEEALSLPLLRMIPVKQLFAGGSTPSEHKMGPLSIALPPSLFSSFTTTLVGGMEVVYCANHSLKGLTDFSPQCKCVSTLSMGRVTCASMMRRSTTARGVIQIR